MLINITTYGAAGDGTMLCTEQIQKAIDDCAKEGGGYVHVPAGKYLTGTIELKSHVFLDLAPGAELLGSKDFSHYRAPRRRSTWHPWTIAEPLTHCYALIFAEEAVNVGVTGYGKINVQRGTEYPDTLGDAGRPYLLVFSKCSDVVVRDVSLLNPAFFTFYGMDCKRVKISGVSIHTLGSPNGDGLDFDGGEDVLISNCYIEAGDDCISLKSLDPAVPCRNFAITNCIFKSVWAGVRLGVESIADVSGVTVSNCRFEDCNDGIKIQPTGEGIYEDLTFSNMNMKNVRHPIFISLTRFRTSEKGKGVRPPAGKMRRVLVDNLTAVMPKSEEEGFKVCFNAIVGTPSACIEDVMLRGIHIESYGSGTMEMAERIDVPELLDFTELYSDAIHFFGELPSAVLYVRNINRLSISDTRLACRNKDERPAIFAENIEELKLLNVSSGGTQGLITAASCINPILSCCTQEGNQVKDIIGLPEDKQFLLRKAREVALEMDCVMDEWASVIDLAEKANTLVALPPDNTKPLRVIDALVPSTDCSKKIYAYMNRLCGPVKLFVNEQLAGEFTPKRPYWYLSAWAVDITEHIEHSGANRIRLSLCAEGEYGAMMGLPQFCGDFKGVQNGLYSPLEIRCGEI